MQTIDHVVKIRGRQVVDIHPPVIVSHNQQIDYLDIWTDETWAGYDAYSVVFHRAHVDDVELIYAPGDSTRVMIPASHIAEKGWLSFTVKAIKGDDVRLVTASKGARIEVTPSGVFEGSEPTAEQLTAIEQATLDAETAAQAADAAAVNANDAAAQVDEALDDIADALETAQEASRVANEAAETAEQAAETAAGIVAPTLTVTQISGGVRVDGHDSTHGDTSAYVLNGEKGEVGPVGPAGPAGQPGTPGQTGPSGADGITPTVTVTSITGGHRVSFDYGTGDPRNTSVDIMDGEVGQQGTPGTPGADGDDGITPTVTVTSITGGHNIAFSYGSGDSRNRDVNIMDGADGDDYVLTASDKSDIATIVYGMLNNLEEGSY